MDGSPQGHLTAQDEVEGQNHLNFTKHTERRGSLFCISLGHRLQPALKVYPCGCPPMQSFVVVHTEVFEPPCETATYVSDLPVPTPQLTKIVRSAATKHTNSFTKLSACSGKVEADRKVMVS